MMYLSLFLFTLSPTSADFEKMRLKMVEKQIVARGISNKNVLFSMKKVPRHLFVSEHLRLQAYSDYPLPIGSGQTISQPYIVALMTELINPQKNDRVLEIGTGSGYQAAVLAEITKEVYTIEIIPELAESAGELLKNLGYKNINVKTGDGFLGWKEHSPFDGIIVTAASSKIPRNLINQLKEGGRLVMPVGDDYQVLELFWKEGGKMKEKDIIPVRFVPMTGIVKGEVKLPGPKYKGKISLEEAITGRHSVREYRKIPLNLSEISQVLWSAAGKKVDWITSASRTAPSAGGIYPLNFYVVIGDVEDMPQGLYYYECDEHKLKMVREGDLRNELYSACWKQDMVLNAPASILITGNGKKIASRYGERGINRYLYLDAGHCGENIYLQCGTLGLGTVALGAFDDEKVKKVVGKNDETPLYVFPIGRK